MKTKLLVAILVALGLGLGSTFVYAQGQGVGPPEDRGPGFDVPDPGSRSPAGETGSANAAQGLQGLGIASEHAAPAAAGGLETAIDAILRAIGGEPPDDD